MITAEDKFVFDLQGYIIIKNVLTSEEIAEINEVCDRIFPRDYSNVENVKENYLGKGTYTETLVYLPTNTIRC